jgi:hypothetical protein
LDGGLGGAAVDVPDVLDGGEGSAAITRGVSMKLTSSARATALKIDREANRSPRKNSGLQNRGSDRVTGATHPK